MKHQTLDDRSGTWKLKSHCIVACYTESEASVRPVLFCKSAVCVNVIILSESLFRVRWRSSPLVLLCLSHVLRFQILRYTANKNSGEKNGAMLQTFNPTLYEYTNIVLRIMELFTNIFCLQSSAFNVLYLILELNYKHDKPSYYTNV